MFADDDIPQGEREVSGPFDVRRLRAGNYIDLAALIRADSFPGFDPAVRRYQDWDLWLNIALKQGGIRAVCARAVVSIIACIHTV